MKFYRDLFEASLNRVVPERDKQRFFQAFYSTFIHMSPETEQHFSQRSGEAGQLWGGDRFCMRGSLPRKTREALRDKDLGRTSRICTAGRKMRFCYDLCDEFCTITDC
ncbi:Uncharacterised protein [Klebsiella pneumoniae]|nr:Uncharacterised protein [Klebsiella pneumoniae]